MILTFPPKPKIQLKKICVALTELSPCGVKELRQELVLEHHMELVNKDMGALALLPVEGNTVEDGVCDHLAEDVQRTGDIELNAICFASGSGCSSSISRRVQRVEILYATTKLLILQSPN